MWQTGLVPDAGQRGENKKGDDFFVSRKPRLVMQILFFSSFNHTHKILSLHSGSTGSVLFVCAWQNKSVKCSYIRRAARWTITSPTFSNLPAIPGPRIFCFLLLLSSRVVKTRTVHSLTQHPSFTTAIDPTETSAILVCLPQKCRVAPSRGRFLPPLEGANLLFAVRFEREPTDEPARGTSPPPTDDDLIN